MAERFLTAYNTTTGEKLSNPVPEHWFDHPVLGKNISRTPRSWAAAAKKATVKPAAEAPQTRTDSRTEPTTAPASGDDEKE